MMKNHILGRLILEIQTAYILLILLSNGFPFMIEQTPVRINFHSRTSLPPSSKKTAIRRTRYSSPGLLPYLKSALRMYMLIEFWTNG